MEPHTNAGVATGDTKINLLADRNFLETDISSAFPSSITPVIPPTTFLFFLRFNLIENANDLATGD
jgi:hypothetical protein